MRERLAWARGAILPGRGSLRWRLFWLVGGVGLGTLLVVNLAWLPGQIREIQEAQAELQRVAALGIREQIRIFIEEKERALSSQAKVFRGPVIDGDHEALAGFAHRFLQREPAFEEIGIIDGNGHERFRLSRRRVIDPHDLRDQSSSPLFREAMLRDIFWSPVAITEVSEPWATLAVPVRRSERAVVGVLYGVINLKALWTLTGDFELSRGGRAYVVDDAGRLIAASDSSLVLKQLSFADRPLVRELVLAPERRGGFVTGRYTNEHQTDVVATGLGLERPRWAVAVEQPRALLAAAVGRIIWFFAGLSGLGLLLSFSLAQVVSRRVTRPITRLREGVERFGKGDLGHRVAVDGTDEIGQLAGQFNEMADQLHAYHDHLQRTVAETMRDLSALYAITTPISGASELQAVLDDAVARICNVTQADASVIRFADDTGHFVLSAHRGLSEGCMRSMPATTAEPGITARVMQSGGVLIAEDLATDDRFPRGLLAQDGFRSAAYLPLKTPEQVFGILIVASRELGRINQRQADLFTAIAQQMSVTLENARLYQAQKVRATRLRTLAALNQLVSSSLDADEVLRRISQAALDLMNAAVVEFWIADEAAQMTELRILSDAQAAGSKRLTRLRYGQGGVGWVAVHRRALNIADVLADPRIRLPEWFKELGLTSGLWLPIATQDELLGVLSILGRQPFHLGPDDQELVDTFVAQAAVAIRNARLYASTQAQAAALKIKNAELDSFSYSVSHDLKAPLVTVQGMAGLLLAGYGTQLDADGRHYLERLQANVDQMEHLISDVLALSRVGREARPAEAVEVAALVDELIGKMNGLIEARGAKVIVREAGTLWGIPTQIEQVFTNLISNAVKYAGDTATPMVEIGVASRDAFLECYVKDNGIGIDPAYHQKIFEMFQRLKDVEAEGTGVGLAIVKKIVEGAGGQIWVESAKGQGATFRFTWPARRPEQEPMD